MAKSEWIWGIINGGPWVCCCCWKLKKGWFAIRFDRANNDYGKNSRYVCRRCARSIAGRYNEYGDGK